MFKRTLIPLLTLLLIALAAPDVIASKVTNIIDCMEGVKKQHNQRYPAHSID